jgi:hypothetical protein
MCFRRAPAKELTLVRESRSLILAPTDEDALAQFILKVAFSMPSDTANPVLQAVFALASLQLQGTSKSFWYKHLALTSVTESSESLNEVTLLQNLMALMLLYHHEVILYDLLQFALVS